MEIQLIVADGPGDCNRELEKLEQCASRHATAGCAIRPDQAYGFDSGTPRSQQKASEGRSSACRALDAAGQGDRTAAQLSARARPKSALSRCGVTGSSRTAPGMPMASSMAEAIAAPTPVMPLSPAPLMPSGLSGVV